SGPERKKCHRPEQSGAARKRTENHVRNGFRALAAARSKICRRLRGLSATSSSFAVPVKLDPADLALDPQFLEKRPAVSSDEAGRNQPLGAGLEKQRAEELNRRQHDEESGDALSRAGHDGPAVLKFAFLLALFITPLGRGLNRAETKTDDAAGEQRHG